MPNKLDAFLQALSEASGVPVEYLRESGFMNMAPDVAAKLRDTPDCSPEQYQETLLECRAMTPQLMQACAHPDVQQWVKAHSKLESFRVREAIASRALKAKNGPQTLEPWMGSRATILERLRSSGAEWWPHTYRLGEDQEIRASGINAYMRTLPSDRQWELKMILDTVDGGMAIMGNARWADQAFPVIRMGHRYAAALMSTKIPKLDIRPPWKAFVIEVPEGLLWSSDEDGTRCPIVLIKCWYHKNLTADGGLRDALSFTAISLPGGDKSPPTLQRYCQSIEELQSGEIQEDVHDDLRSAFAIDLDDGDERTLAALTRLVLNSCLAMSNPEDVKPMGKHPTGWTKGPGRSDEPLLRAFMLGRDVKVDCRPALKDYLDGRKRSLMTVQFLVRGHWRNQAFGEGLQQRKSIWIEPHWKGPEDALILSRGHQLEGA